MRLHPAEAAQGLPACLFWRSVPVTDSSIVRLPPMLPPGAMDGDVAALAQARTTWRAAKCIPFSVRGRHRCWGMAKCSQGTESRSVTAGVALCAQAFPTWSELSIISSVWSFEAFFQVRLARS